MTSKKRDKRTAPPKDRRAYSGPESQPFWNRVGALTDSRAHSAAYSLGCVLQNLENDVHRMLVLWEEDQVRHGG